MRVNSTYKGITVVVLAIFFIASAFTELPDRDLLSKQVNLKIRQIGHQLLLQAGDSTSRVLPVTEITEGTFQLNFEKGFFFNHDSLIQLSQNLLPKKEFPSGYTVTVHEPINSNIVYGFQLRNFLKDDIACRRRFQPAGLYRIEITFHDLYKKSTVEPAKIVFSGMLALLGVTLLIGRLGKKSNSKIEFASLGKFRFDVKDQRLLIDDEVITLTEKECKVLELLHKKFGELIPRETLMQEIWINEGVITGRSLDMFVSKLRKKLSRDPELRITNVHGKGYKLETSAG